MTSGNNSHLTAIQRDKPSFPLRRLLKDAFLKGDVLDFGCGFGSDADYLISLGYNCDKYDPHYFPEYPKKKYDTIISFYVLNVIDKETQTKVLIQISNLLKPNGSAFFSVRRDIVREGFRIHKVHKKPTFQCNVTLPFESILLNDFCEIYLYRKINELAKTNSSCIFCSPNNEMKLICESASSYALYDKYPVNTGHSLIIPKRHIENYFDLSQKEKTSCWIMVDEVKSILTKEFNVADFNVGINIGKYAGQTINHAHIHLIPRYENDTSEVIGGVRGVIPEKRNYLR